jgi:hypothetical protein
MTSDLVAYPHPHLRFRGSGSSILERSCLRMYLRARSKSDEVSGHFMCAFAPALCLLLAQTMLACRLFGSSSGPMTGRGLCWKADVTVYCYCLAQTCAVIQDALAVGSVTDISHWVLVCARVWACVRACVLSGVRHTGTRALTSAPRPTAANPSPV